MSASDDLTLHKAPPDHLRYGLSSLEAAHAQKHPVEVLQKSQAKSEWAMKLDMARRQYGSHMAMRLETERQTFGRAHHLPGLKSSSIGKDTVMGTDVSIDFSEYLNGKIRIHPRVTDFVYEYLCVFPFHSRHFHTI